MAEPFVELRFGERLLPLDADTVVGEVRGEGTLVLTLQGLPWASGDACPWKVRVRGVEVPLWRRGAGAMWRDDSVLRTSVGPLAVEVSGGGRTWRAGMEVVPTKLTWEGICQILADLDTAAEEVARAQGWSGDRLDTDGLLDLVESLVGSLSEAASLIRRHPLHRRRERVRAVADSGGATAARDVRWLARHPAAACRAGGGARSVSVRRERAIDVDVPENRGVLGVFQRIEEGLEATRLRVDVEDRRLEGRRALWGASPRRMGVQADAPTAPSRLRRQHERVVDLQRQVAWARQRTGLPSDLPAVPRLVRTHAVASQPAYWRMLEVQRALELFDPWAPARWAPVSDLDLLYERWCVVMMARAMCRWAGVALGEHLRVVVQDADVAVRPGPLLTVQRGEITARLLYEPAYAYGGDAPLVKLQEGRPWRPDLVIELSRSGHPFQLHVFDAKHRRDPARRRDGGLPLDAWSQLWFRYADGMGDRDTGMPVVGSVWMLWPGDRARRVMRTPAMWTDGWPMDRARTGAISLRPGVSGCVSMLEETLATLLGWDGLGR